MKKLLFLTVTVILALSLTASAMAAALSPALDVIAHSVNMTVSAPSGETVGFTPSQFAGAAGVEEYESIRITALPDETEGTLMYNDAAVCAGQVIAYDKTEKLSFMPTDGTERSSFEFTFDGSYTMVCEMVLDGSVNSAPTAGPMPARTTLCIAPCAGVMRAADPDNDALNFEVTKHPESGRLEYNRSTGSFVFYPDGKAGDVSFEYSVRDGKGGVSNTARVDISVRADVPAVSFDDMDGSAYVAAAVTMADMGVMSYSEDGSKLYFEPDKEVTRLEFLVSAMNAFGADNFPVVSSSGFYDDFDIPDAYKSYVYSASKLGIVAGTVVDGQRCFLPNKAITAAEAAVILNNVIGYEAASEAVDDTVPAWAADSVSAVYELGITDSTVNTELTKEAAADMLYRLCSLMY